MHELLRKKRILVFIVLFWKGRSLALDVVVGGSIMKVLQRRDGFFWDDGERRRRDHIMKVYRSEFFARRERKRSIYRD